ncbi:dTMP kinase [Luteimonas gilva]|uniref:Thymidylate kinase n=1 Tax=Luteimonas gilva TaxID=2572684 RepID=A0A4U5JW36_9GAMM|nr:dTMP kinase [Luteimonas gilva]TKR32938.1 dTMP kinase [Luteimonas gilva]
MTGLAVQERFITLEGGEGAGKSTVIAALRDALEAAGEDVVCTREPGGTPLAEEIRGLLLDPQHEAAVPQAELLLVFAARAQHVKRTILPALQRGAWVICDRFTDSSYAYQGGGRGLDAQFIAELERRAVGILPAMTLLLDIDVHEGRVRTSSRDLWPDRIEREQEDFFARARGVFLMRAEADPGRFRVIDAARPRERVAAEAVAHLLRLRESSR